MSELQLLQEELSKLPPEQQESWAGWFRHELTELREHDAWFEGLSAEQFDHLRGMIQEGIDSGDDGVLDMDEIIREARVQWDARKHQN